jgi:hypothetical protein
LGNSDTELVHITEGRCCKAQKEENRVGKNVKRNKRLTMENRVKDKKEIGDFNAFYKEQHKRITEDFCAGLNDDESKSLIKDYSNGYLLETLSDAQDECATDYIWKKYDSKDMLKKMEERKRKNNAVDEKYLRALIRE